MDNCIFCKIASHEIDSQIEYEDDQVIVFHDNNPQAPVHMLVIPRRHIDKVQSLEQGDGQLIGHMILVARQEAQKAGLNEKGYRLVMNNGREGGQAVFHIHLHLLGGRPMKWPPG